MGHALCQSADHARPHAGDMLPAFAMGRFGTTDELATLICFLASPLSDYINRGPVTIDGGKYVCQF